MDLETILGYTPLSGLNESCKGLNIRLYWPETLVSPWCDSPLSLLTSLIKFDTLTVVIASLYLGFSSIYNTSIYSLIFRVYDAFLFSRARRVSLDPPRFV